MDRTFQSRCLAVALLFTLGLSLLSVRLIYLQVLRHDYYAAIADEEHIHKVVLRSERGRIFDRRGQLLACDEPAYSVVADKVHLADLSICLAGLSVADGIPPRDLRRIYPEDELRGRYLQYVVETIARPLGYHGWELARTIQHNQLTEVTLGKDFSAEAASQLESLLEAAGIRGVYTRKGSERFYPSPRRLAHVLGFLDHEGAAQTGAEAAADFHLRGRDGHRFIERDRRGREIAAYRGDIRPPVDGKDVRLTIDMRLQEAVESVLDEVGDDPEGIYVPRLGARKTMVVLLDPRTGDVLAMANRPHFDLATREGIGGAEASYRNSALADLYEPGSTFKIVTLGGVFDRGLVSPTTSVFCHHGRFVEDGVELRDTHPYGELTVDKVMAKSSNIGAYKLARQLGRQGFFGYVRAFGFGEPTGIGLDLESGGVVVPPEKWTRPDFSRMAMGYRVSVTALQMASAVGAVANGGELVPPRVLDAVLESDGSVATVFPRRPARRVLSEPAARRVADAMAGVVAEGGTGTRAALDGYTVAGKTGTSQRYDEELKRYVGGSYVVSFAGFLPAEDPQFVGVVVVDDPKIDYVRLYGGTIAAPIFRRIAERAVAVLGIPPTEPLLNTVARRDVSPATATPTD